VSGRLLFSWEKTVRLDLGSAEHWPLTLLEPRNQRAGNRRNPEARQAASSSAATVCNDCKPPRYRSVAQCAITSVRPPP